MAMAKTAQLIVAEEPEDNEIVVYQEKPSKEEVLDNHLELSEQDLPDLEIHMPAEITFSLSKIPGAELSEQELEVKENEQEEKKDEAKLDDKPIKDRWNWNEGGHKEFLNWLDKMLKDLPKHSGKDSAGCERVIAYLRKLDNEISKCMQSDTDGIVDASKVEEARDQIDDGITRLEEHLEKINNTRFKNKGKKKKADIEENGIVKESQKSTHVGGIIISVPLLISSLARACINATVSNGRDLESCVKKAVKMYDLNKREQAELIQLLMDMNYPMRRDRLHDFDKEPFEPTSSKNLELGPNYSS